MNNTLHGNVPDSCAVALLLIDVINNLDFPNNRLLVKQSARLGRQIAHLKARCVQQGIPVIYANDNHGKWQSDLSAVIKQARQPEAPGREMVEQLIPDKSDYIVLKPKHSAFDATPLDTLLQYLNAKKIIIAGLTTNACVLITAAECYVRDLGILVPSDCVAALSTKDHQRALEIMRSSFDADTSASKHLSLTSLRRTLSRRPVTTRT